MLRQRHPAAAETKKMRNIMVAVGCVVAATTVWAQGPKIGQWEYQSEMTIPGVSLPPGMQMPKMPEGMQLPPGMSMPQMSGDGMVQRMSFRSCVTESEPVPMDRQGGHDCKLTRMDRKGDSVNWAVECQTPEGLMTGDGTGTYKGDRMDAVIKMKGTANGRPMEMTQKLQGRYLGPCPAK